MAPPFRLRLRRRGRRDLVPRFAISSAFALAFAWAAIFWVVTREAEERGRQQVAARATGVAARIAPSLTDADFSRRASPSRRAELDALLERELVGNLLRLAELEAALRSAVETAASRTRLAS